MFLLIANLATSRLQAKILTAYEYLTTVITVNVYYYDRNCNFVSNFLQLRHGYHNLNHKFCDYNTMRYVQWLFNREDINKIVYKYLIIIVMVREA